MTAASTLPADLLAQELRGPRYTSYPTALSFGPQFSISDYVAAARSSVLGGAPLSIYVHVPFCASNCYYCGCNRVVTRSSERIERYVAALLAEIRMQSALFGQRQAVQQIHFGGGTPNLLGHAHFAQILRAIRSHFRVGGAAELEMSMEVDPRHAGADDIAAWRLLGFNRLSFGVQDVDLLVQRAINRIQSVSQIAALTTAAREAGYSSLNYDLVYGLPLQTLSSFSRTLDFVIAQRPERIAAYHYAHLPARFPAQRAIDDQQLPLTAQRQQLRELIASRLQAAGYVAIGLDHYALPDDPLSVALRDGSLHRNFQGYSTQSNCDLIGIGVSAISKLDGCFAQNNSDLDRYLAAVEGGRLPLMRGYRPNDDDRLRADVIEAIMCTGKVDFQQIEGRHGVELPARFETEMQRLRQLDPQQDWMSYGDWGLKVEEQGRALLRVVAMVFDRHLRLAATPALHSPTL
ncbi:oxygen-independent coproporphyrinogen III oxidase [Hydrocarboniphaga sp.]|uniref:oxygen-independent coproporphyrinogen III oxidase n=1 Tax=Hydrocarboniphaga sp. TaxID=2033016 RepID=UPI003D11C65D